MAVQYAPTKLRVPPGFQNLLEGLSREVLREQPANIIQFAANYFKDQLVIRNDTGVDDAQKGSDMEKLMKDEEIDIDLNDPSTADAAMKIQAVFRGHKSRQEAKQKKDEETAATKIQAGFRGHQARKSIKDMKSSGENPDDEVRITPAATDELEEREYVKSVIINENAEEALGNSIQDYNDPEYEKAATKIQAGFRGFKTREDMKEKLSKSNTEQDEQDQNNSNDNENIDEEVDTAKEEEAALKIQASFRGHKARQEVNAMKSAQSQEDAAPAESTDYIEEHATAAVKIQAGYRGYVARKEVDKIRSSNTEEDAPIENDSEGNASREEAAIKIQAGYRGFVARKEVDELRDSKSKQEVTEADAATKIQAGYRGYVARKEVEKMKETQGDAQVVVEDGGANEEENDSEQRAKAATKIQASYRGYKTRASMKQDQPPGTNESADESAPDATAAQDEN